MPDRTMTAATASHRDFVPVDTDAIPGLVHAYRIGADGLAEALPADFTLADSLGAGTDWYWLHVNLADARACAWLETIGDLPAKVRAFVRAHHDHQQLNALPGCLYGVIADFERSL